MPVRSLNSPVMRWPDRAAVLESARRWARSLANSDPSILAIGCFGSYARGDNGVGSDLDLLVVYQPPAQLGHWDVNELPVPTDLLVYTIEQWPHIPQQPPRFARTLDRELVWLHGEMPRLVRSVNSRN